MSQRILVGVVVINDSVGLSMLRGIARYARQESLWDFDRTRPLPLLGIEDVPRWRGDGLIIQLFDMNSVRNLVRRRVKIVNISHRMGKCPLPRVGPDDLSIGRLGAEHLLQRGFRNLAFCGFAGHWYSDMRRKGFEDRLAGEGIHRRFFIPDSLDIRDDFDQLVQWLKELPKPVGIMACNDIRGRHIVEQCRQLSFRVPEDVAVLGVDNDEWQSEMVRMPLSSVDPDHQAIGFEGARMLSQLLRGETVESKHRLVPPLGVVVRKSTDVIAAEDPLVARAMAYIRNASERPLTVENILGEIRVSRRLLETRLKRSMGLTPQQAIWQVHVERAKVLLLGESLLMHEVARRSGFNSPERLSVVFRRETGMSPTEYRRRFRGT
jgi:LacI family transcriptional regulator